MADAPPHLHSFILDDELAVTMVGQREGLVSGNSVKKADRTKGGKYVDTKDRICIWSGNRWNCEHGRQRHGCKECGGAGICEHGRVRSVCKECGGAGICEHGRVRSVCKECKARKNLAVLPLVVSASDVASGDAADDTAMSLALPPLLCSASFLPIP